MSSMKKAMMATLAMAMLASQGGYGFAPGLYDTDDSPRSRSGHGQRELSPEEKARIHRQYENQLHEFTIKGEVIKASNKKTAMKIYANRHPELKKNKKH